MIIRQAMGQVQKQGNAFPILGGFNTYMHCECYCWPGDIDVDFVAAVEL